MLPGLAPVPLLLMICEPFEVLEFALYRRTALNQGPSGRRASTLASPLSHFMVTREQLVELLENIALLLELKGENPFKIRAYRSAAASASSYPGDILEEARQGRLESIPGIGQAIAGKITGFVATGQLDYYNQLRAAYPDSLFELFHLRGLGPRKIKALHEALGVSSLADLKRVCTSGEAAALPGFGAKTAAKILEAIAFRVSNAERFRLGDVLPLAMVLRESLREHPASLQVSEAGSVRRGCETVHDLDFIVATSDPCAVLDAFTRSQEVREILSNGETKATVVLHNGLQCDLRAVSNLEYPFALQYFTGSKEHNVVLRGRARDQGFTLNEYRLAPLDENGPAPPEINTEEDLYAALGLPWIEPALRENAGEFEAAATGTLPTLLRQENLRGTFHVHTTASDGRSSLQEMADAAQALGLQYLGIADHSRSSVQANGLDAKRLEAQIAEIRRLNQSLEGFRLFAGVECDILRDGSLDFDDDVLSQLDYVVASVHSSFQLPEKDQTERILRAIRNPWVTILGHPTGRLLLERDPYALDLPAVIDACAETGTWIELNANPWRLDLDWRWWRRARDRGVRCVINPDAHHTSGLQDLHFGVLAARKGWLRRDDVVNCLPLKDMEKALLLKRRA